MDLLGEKSKKVRKPNIETERKKVEVLQRKLILEQERFLKPGNCNKYLNTLIDVYLYDGIQGSKIPSKLNEINIKSQRKTLESKYTIKWEREVRQPKIITDDGKITDFSEKIVLVQENYIILVMLAEYFVKVIRESKLLLNIQKVQEKNSFKSLTLVVYGLKDFCRNHKQAIGLKQTEIKLTQIQLLAGCNYRMHETPEDLALTVVQFSKSIAEEPYKQKQYNKIDQEQLYFTNEIQNNVDVREREGVARLWQNQLMKLPKVTWEVAQSITKEYPFPKLLIEAYEHSSNPAALLADLPIIRTGPLNKHRRIGPELSRKIHTLLISTNESDLI